ncbi:polysaccharide biosynthesis/export family protein [Paracoccaceae bacterium]|nr:polysaccharide biosynthesis/export family protein [Paracoccaceae bacterium]
MPWIFSDRLSQAQFSLWSTNRLIFFLVMLIGGLSLSACGRVYFPIELKTISRSDRSEKQQDSNVVIVPMTTRNIELANSSPYKRYIIEAGDLKEPAKLVPSETALVEKLPPINDPGPYLIGVGDVIAYEELIVNIGGQNARAARNLIVNEDGLINFFQLGRIRAEGKTLTELEDILYKKVVETGGNTDFNLSIRDFRSKYFSVSLGMKTKSIPYVSTPLFVEQILEEIPVSPTADAKILIFRGDEKYSLSYNNLIRNTQRKVRVFPGDRIFVNPLNYKKEKVLLVGETGAQRAIPINSNLRPSLSDAIFSGSVLNSTTSDFSQIYILRKKKETFQAFHLDITDPTRVSLANQFEMRPDDIVFVATQPLSLYSRTLSQILGSTGLTLQARDTIRTEIGN